MTHNADALKEKVTQLQDQKAFYQEQLLEKDKQIAVLNAKLNYHRRDNEKREARSVSVPRTSGIRAPMSSVQVPLHTNNHLKPRQDTLNLNLSQVHYEQHRCRANGSILSQYSSIHMGGADLDKSN